MLFSHSRILPAFSMAMFAVIVLTAGCSKELSKTESDSNSNQSQDITSVTAKSTSESESTSETESAEHLQAEGPLYCKVAIGPSRDLICEMEVDFEEMQVRFDVNGDEKFSDDETFPIIVKPIIANTHYFESVVTSEIQQGEDVHTGLTLKLSKTEGKISAAINMKMWGIENSNTDANLVPLSLSAVRDSAPLIHFNGPLTMGRYRETTKFKIDKVTDFYSFVGTKGEGEGTFTAIENTEIPEGASPVAEFTFPNRVKGEPPITVKSNLTVRC